MAFPQVASITQTTFNSNTTAHAVSMPATVAVDDLLISYFSNDGSATVTTPTGWTLRSSNAQGSTCRHSVYVKKADGTEGGTTVDHVTSASEGGTAQVYRILAADWSGTLADVVVGTAATGTSTNPDSPSLTAGAAQDYLWIASYGNDAAVTATGYPTNYTNGTNTAAAAASAGTGTARRELNTATEDPGTFTLSASEDWVAQTLAVPPAAGGITGTGASTLAGVTSAGTGVYGSVTGTGASTLAGVTSAGTGVYGSVSGTGASTLAGVTSAGSGTYTPAAITGTGSSTLAGVTSAGSGVYGSVTGSGASTLAGVTSVGTGTYTPAGITGTGSSTLEGVTSAGAGTYTPPAITGTGASTLAGVTSVGTGTFAPPNFTGTGSSTLDGVASAGTGTYTPGATTGTGASTLGGVTSTGSGVFTAFVPDVDISDMECAVLMGEAACETLRPTAVSRVFT